jgi:hypothetical protein
MSLGIMGVPRTTRPDLLRRGVLLLFFAFGMAIFVANGRAQSTNAFVISDVHVDVTGATAADARKQAISQGERRAFERLLTRLTLSYDRSKLPQVNQEDISEYIRDFSVSNAKNSTVRYLADLSFRFKPSEVRALLRDLGIEFAETVSKPVLLLPVYEVAGAVSLWDDPNPWRKLWSGKSTSDGLVPIVLARGDLQDLRTIAGEQAIRGDKQRLTAIGRRYNVTTVLVAHAKAVTVKGGRLGLQVNVVSYGADQREQYIELDIAPEGGDLTALLGKAVEETASAIEDRWKEANLLRFERSSVLAATLALRALTDWVEARRRLKKIAVIEHVDLVLISRNEARLNIFYLGDPDQLALAMAQTDIKLTENEGSWSMQLLKLRNSGKTKAGR